jgi:putative membrane protein insertion efficiency factor
MCRFHPSCSVYAMGAIGVHGPFKGLWLALRRLTRCHPFTAGGLDPVPTKDGQKAADLLRESLPFIAEQLDAPPPPYLAAVLPRVRDDADSSKPC